MKRFLIVDGHSLAHRGFHAIRTKLTAPDGTPTAMIAGFMNMLFKVQDEFEPDFTCTVFDAGGKTFRHDLLASYKSGRKTLDEDLRIQIPILQDLLRHMGYSVFAMTGVEADDVAASLAKLAQSHGHEVILLSSDKDLLQLLSSDVIMIRPVKNGISGAELYTSESFVCEYGFSPESMPDYLAITGDRADNIAGIQGIGEIGAKKLLASHHTLEGIFAALDRLPKSTRSRLEAHGLDSATWTRDNVIKLRDDIFTSDSDSGSRTLWDIMNATPDIQGTQELASRLGLNRVLRRMGLTPKALTQTQTQTLDFRMPDAEILTIDYKSELMEHPERFKSDAHARVFDLRTAYYMLHPDQTSRRFPDIIRDIDASDSPAMKLAELAGTLNAQILSHDGLSHVMNDIDLPLIPVLNSMQAHGIRLDRSKFSMIQDRLEARILQIEAQVTNSAGLRVNLNSPQQVSWLLFEKLGFSPEGKARNNGSFPTDALTLERLAKYTASEIPALILEHRELSKMLSGFVIPLQRAADSENVIHTTFEPSMTGTGRISSREPNMQNIPAFGQWAELIKSGLVPVNPENVFVSADYSQIELRVLAHLSGDSRLIEAFQNNRDVHSQTASWAFGIIPELVTPELRRAAKIINFGLLYGMSSFGLAERLGISRNDARSIMQRYFDTLPDVRSFIHDTVRTARERGYTRTLEGRIRPTCEIPATGTALDRAIINSPIQGTAADIARTAMTRFISQSQSQSQVQSGGGEGIFLQVHDALFCECSPDVI